jgi:two-component system, chemotaxis family, sensor kinase CheA
MTTETMLATFADAMRRRIDELTTGLMVSGIESIKPKDLTPLAKEAEQNGLPETASATKALVKKLRKNEPDESVRRQTLYDGLNKMLLAFEHETAVTELAKDGPEGSMAATPTLAPTSAPARATPSTFAEDPELIADFLMEASEHLALIESQLLELERNPGAMEVLHSVFRTFHTIKGLAGFLEFYSIQAVAHEVETLLDLARNEKIIVTPTVVDVVLESADYLKGELSRIEGHLAGTNTAQPADNHALTRKIEQVAATGGTQPASSSSTSEPDAISAFTPNASASPDVTAAPLRDEKTQDRAAPVEGAKSLDTGSVRVETAKLDHLLDMVGEMVIAQSLIRHNPVLAASMDARLLADIAQLSRNTAEVQRTTMAMRMIPVGQLFQRTARLIRDLSRKVGKQIVLETSGEDTEVDKTIAEELSDPLLHMVRNSVDHGIERPEERMATGKDPVARIGLKAYHQAGQIVIEISDDGRGLNQEKILAKAVQNGVIESGSQLSEAEIHQLIFEPGFSTAEKITDVSGRGVGMDVVRRNVQKLRGRIDTHSVAGEGTTFFIKLPLTLAIIDGLVVVVGRSRYIVPIFAVREMFRPAPDVLSTVQGQHEMALVRGSLLPIVRLHRRFGIAANAIEPSDGLLVVAECDGKQFCLLVDDLVGKQEVVIKSLGETFKDTSGLAGCAILGDGQVGLILDMDGIYRGVAR